MAARNEFVNSEFYWPLMDLAATSCLAEKGM